MPVAHLHRHFEALLQPLFVLVIDSQFVDDHFDVVVLVSVHLHALGHLHDFAIHSGIEIAFLTDAVEEFAVVAFTALNEWCQEEDALAVVLFQQEVHHVLFGVFDHLLACLITESLASTGIEQSQIVIDFCHRSHRGAWALVGGLLLDADDGR